MLAFLLCGAQKVLRYHSNLVLPSPLLSYSAYCKYNAKKASTFVFLCFLLLRKAVRENSKYLIFICGNRVGDWLLSFLFVCLGVLVVLVFWGVFCGFWFFSGFVSLKLRQA